jgi:DNA-directed RNA polymerase subunit RPC12/RpoP
MENVLRAWNCRGCGRSNNTNIEPDGTVKCEYCSDVKRIQPSRIRGGETPLQVSRFSTRRADAPSPGTRPRHHEEVFSR